MLVFSTRLPLKNNVTQENCLQLFFKWIIDSPNYSIEDIQYDTSSHRDFDYTSGNQSISIRHYKDSNVEISACRLENRETTAEWINDCILLNENGHKSLMIQLNCNRTNFEIELPPIHKPYIVRQFVESGLCCDDGNIPIIDTPLDADQKYYNTCVDIMNGVCNYSMPVVYISCDFWGHTAINPNYLARSLSGVAHVFVERNRETALKLRDDTNGNNAHTEYVGIYFPGSSYCQKYSLKYYINAKAMARDIINAIWKALVNRLDSSTYNWHHIIALQARQKMAELQYISLQDKAQLSEYMDTFDAENNSLRSQINELNSEIYSLRSQLDTLRSSFNEDSSEKCFYKSGSELDLYNGEKSDLLYSILSQVLVKYEPTSRPYLLIQSLLAANPRIGECEHVITGVTSVFSSGGKLNSQSKTHLRKLGFAIEEDGPHYKIIFHDPRYMFTVSKTPSDHREGKNLIAQIRNMINVEHKF